MEPTNPVVSPKPEDQSVTPVWLPAVRAAESKQASDITVLDLREVTTFTDYFILCTGSNPRQIQAIADEVLVRLKESGERAAGTEGYENAEWILIDYSNYIVHVFSKKSREFYDLERLWRHARLVEIPEAEE
ncbi:MAG: ribosome silencing factor [bacterium]|nr:ribosome silencing factor [bacterium]